MIDQVKKFIVGHGAVERDCVPVPLVEVVARSDRGIASTQTSGQIRITLEADAPRRRTERGTSANIRRPP
jgi:hypothetical protein